MAKWFKCDADITGVIEDDQIALTSGIRQSGSLSITNGFSHCLSDKLPLELLSNDEEGVPSIIELEVQMDGKCFSSTNEGVLSTEETVLFEEVRDTPSILHQDERESLVELQSKVVMNDEKISLLTPHELESMKLNALESDSEKEISSKRVVTSNLNHAPILELEKSPTGNEPKPLVVLHESETYYVCPIEQCSKGFPKLSIAKTHITTHNGVRQFKVFLWFLKLLL